MPLTLAQAVVQRNLAPLDLVSALEKCENMALKLKAAKFLTDAGKKGVDDMRAYARELMEGNGDGEA